MKQMTVNSGIGRKRERERDREREGRLLKDEIRRYVVGAG